MTAHDQSTSAKARVPLEPVVSLGDAAATYCESNGTRLLSWGDPEPLEAIARAAGRSYSARSPE